MSLKLVKGGLQFREVARVSRGVNLAVIRLAVFTVIRHNGII